MLAGLLQSGKPANARSWLNLGMTLQERLEEVMAATGWDRADLVRVSGQSSSVVSQWLGKGSKIIHSIGKIEAAEAIAHASGFAPLWVAKGLGPKHAGPASIAGAPRPVAREPAKGYGPPPLLVLSELVQHLTDSERGIAIAALAAWVQQGCPAESVPRLGALLGEFLPAAPSVALKTGHGR